jgi:beta-aspartyl-peptidase (threonine type)
LSHALGAPGILVHGGAGPHRGPGRDEKLAGCVAAADAGWRVLSAGGSAVDAVEAATRVLEDDPLFDAGYGSYLNRDGIVEVDAILMDGRDRRFGAIAAVRGVRAAVSLARHVMDQSPHAMLAGAGAERFALEMGLDVPADSLISPGALALWQAPQAGLGIAAAPTEGEVGDTVGAVARDGLGHVAAATSTGGTRHKWPGRVGDSPVVGSGAYADDRSGAVSCTGHGESIMRICMAFVAHHALLTGRDPVEAAATAVQELAGLAGGQGGLIVIGSDGRIGWAMNTEAMPVAWHTTGGAGSAFDQARGPVGERLHGPAVTA